MIRIRPFQSRYARPISDLFHHAVHSINPAIYSLQQQEAWAPTPPDYAEWATRLEQTRPFIAESGGRPVGFIELEADGHIDCFYTDPDTQGQGVGSALYQHLLHQAQQRGLKRLYVEASHLAKPVFRHWGFEVVRENRVQRNGIELINFSMQKSL
ncbi:GNAT family N-acetyltransferase [Neptuniibacter halophilus]|uniref:GNAT family N-acetyltransferase n=1 Tax=Neptuniibacter halophilus TaxID=651666 RepID=UPI002573E110|nr:GNAT family N-acetyltransferase [Neptuniibacter halophilus]